MILTTPRLTLRRATRQDLKALHRVFTDVRAMRYWSRPAHASLDQTRAYLDLMINAQDADDFVLIHEGRLIGKAGAWKLPEVGFILHSDHWGKGLAQEALTALIAHLFAHHDIAALTAEADPRNTASLGLLAKLGFVETARAERTLLWGDEWCDSLYLALFREVWQASGS
ncbi:MAG: GNAT family N-acetyltransferase [Paracoccaceae bacterium]|nr:GNAT family N-acetyltransferase [Paracoccaceae bacterium]